MNWKPEKYGGIQTIRVPPNQVWTPDVKHIFKKKIFLKKKTKIFRLFYLIMLMVNMKHHLNLMLLFIIMVI
jgi:hypothetical protein